MTSDGGGASFERLSLEDVELLVIDVPLEPSGADSGLSATEREVARLAVAGLSNKAIAAQRGTSVKTVANQLRAVYGKLGVSSRFELATKMPHG